MDHPNSSLESVVIYSDYFCNNTTTFIYNELIGLNELYDITYLCTERLNQEKFPFDKVEVIPFHEGRLKRKLKWWLEINDLKLNFRNNSFARKLKRFFELKNPKVIQCHFGYEALRLFQNMPSEIREAKIPIVVIFHGHDASFHLNRKSYVRAIKTMLSHSNVFPVFVCEFLKKNLIQKDIDLKLAHIIHCGVNTEFFKRYLYPDSSSPFTFFQVSHFEKRKGIRETIEAFELLLKENPKLHVRMILAGGGPLLDEMKSLVRQMQLQDYIDFPGWIVPSQTKVYMDHANAFVHHSLAINNHTEGIPTAIMEAMSMEMPILSTFHAGIPELVENGVNGILVHERDISAYADSMKKIMTWGFLPKNRELIVKNFSHSVHLEQMNALYKTLIKSI
ncbi:glycosyltransferase family 4 protein [Peijinzhouia sedimentorum]